jgi:lipopolysaccharide/colanic/teichoic acid biosynthesis glycosyltransferase
MSAGGQRRGCDNCPGSCRILRAYGALEIWQVLGRSDISFEEMVRLDYLYVTNWSIWLDLRLMCGTMPAMFDGARAH